MSAAMSTITFARRKHLGKGLGIWRAAPRAQRVRVARSARLKKILSPHDPYTRSPLRKARRRVRTEPLTKELYQKPAARERCARGAARQLWALRIDRSANGRLPSRRTSQRTTERGATWLGNFTSLGRGGKTERSDWETLTAKGAGRA